MTKEQRARLIDAIKSAKLEFGLNGERTTTDAHIREAVRILSLTTKNPILFYCEILNETNTPVFVEDHDDKKKI